MDFLKKVIILLLVINVDAVYSQCNPGITGNTVYCVGESTVLDAGSSFTSYQWSPGGETTQTINVNLPGTYKVTTVNASGCIGVDSVIVSQSPLIVPNIQASNTFVCKGNQIQLSITGAGSSGTYFWDNGLGNGQNKTATILADTDFNVILTDVNNCTDIASISISSIDVPILSTSLQDTFLCEGESANLTVTGAENYTWFPAYGLSSTIGSVVVANPSISTTYSIVGVNEMGGTSCTSNIDINVQVSDLTVNLPLNKTICKDETVAIFANIDGGESPFTYTWYVNDKLRIENGASILDTVNGERIYKLVLVDNNGCSAIKYSTYNNYPELTFNPYINKDTVCPNNTVLFNASISGGTGSPYQFIFDNHYSSTMLNLYPKGTYTYVFEAKDGCGTIKDSITVYTYPIPYVDFIADEYGGCEPKEIKFTSIGTPSNLIDKYSWNFGDNDQNNLSLDASPKHTYNTKGNYNVELKIQTINGCFTDTTKENLIHIEPKPELSFLAEPDYVSIYNPSVYFNNKSTNKDSLSYIWNFGTGDLSNSKSPEYTFSEVGNYEVQLIGFTTYGCSDTIYKFVTVVPEVQFYIPNAFTPDGDDINEVFRPACSNILSSNFKFVVYSRTGLPIFETTKLGEGWDGKTKRGSYAKPGIYVYYFKYQDIYGINYVKEGAFNVIR